MIPEASPDRGGGRSAASGPLRGVRVLEFAGVGPGPFCAMMLSDFGADVVRVDRPDSEPQLPFDVTSRGRSSIELDLKDPAQREVCLQAIAAADVLIEGYRPGVMESLGLGPDVALARNPRLIYGRMTGWGQTGPLAEAPGHDINYIALSGALAALGPPDRPPPPPLNLVGDMGGGALYLAFGIAAALYERASSGMGQVIDAAMLDGASSLMAVFCGLSVAQPGIMMRGALGLAGAAPNYRCYECRDGRYVAVGAIEPHFYRQLLETVGAPFPAPQNPRDSACWVEQAEALAAIFKTRTRDEWSEVLEGRDTCFAPVLTLEEAAGHRHVAARGTFLQRDGVVQPAPAPRFSRTPGAVQGPPPAVGAGGHERLKAWGVPV